MEEKLTFRYAERKDTPLILQFIKELAEYEKLADQVVADEATLEEWLFDKKKGRSHICHGSRTGNRLCPVFSQLLYLSWTSRFVFGRFIYPPPVSGKRLR